MIDTDLVVEALKSPTKWKHFVSELPGSLSGFDFAGDLLENLDFSGLDLEGCNFFNTDVINCNFSRANLYNTNWTGATLFGSDFLGSLLTNSNLNGSEIVDCNFSGCEMSNVGSTEMSVEGVDFSRARGVSQTFLDLAVGDSRTAIPQYLDYPEHWLLDDDEKDELEWVRKLSNFRGDDVIFCVFDGSLLSQNEVASRSRDEIAQTLAHLQKQVRYAVDDKLFHNEMPQIYRALNDYYLSVTESAGNNQPRWSKKLSEIEEIKVGLEGSNLLSLVRSCRKEIEETFPAKLSTLDHILETHLLMTSGLHRWRSFLDSAGEARVTSEVVLQIADTATAVCDFFDEQNEIVDSNIPKTIRILRRFLADPIDTARLGGYGIIRCIEAVFGAIFSFSRKYIARTGEELLELAPKQSVRVLVTGLLATGVAQVFGAFPHLSSWLLGALDVMKGIGLL